MSDVILIEAVIIQLYKSLVRPKLNLQIMFILQILICILITNDLKEQVSILHYNEVCFIVGLSKINKSTKAIKHKSIILPQFGREERRV